jgi:L-cysteine/cystine lyase
MDVTALRKQIPTTRHMTYLNTGWSGPSPVSVIDAIEERLEYESYNGPTSPEVLDSAKEIDLSARRATAGLLNASPDEILLTANTTQGINLVMSGLPWREGDEIVTCDLEHPSILLPSYHLQRRGVKTRVLAFAPDESHETILAKVEDALTDRTRMVFFSHIEYSCGLRMPVEQIRELTGPRGIWMLLDCAQAAGHVPVDMREIDCDFYALPGQKWLLGPDETGALYVKESLIPLIDPALVGWESVKEYDWDGGYVPNTYEIDKLLVGTASAPLRSGYNAGIGFAQWIGVTAIEQRDLSLASALKAGLAAIPGVRVLSPMEGPGCSGLVSFVIDGADPQGACARLWDSYRIVVRDVVRPPSLRASVDFFNTDQEVAQLVEAVRELARGA